MLDVSSFDVPLILRPGGVTIEQLRELLPNVRLYNAADCSGESKTCTAAPKDATVPVSLSAAAAAAAAADSKPALAPGMKYKHYSPSAHVTLVMPRTPLSQMDQVLQQQLASLQQRFGRVGVVRVHPGLHYCDAFPLLTLDDDQAHVNLPVVVYDLVPPAASPLQQQQLVARHLFRALRQLDELDGVEAILLEGVCEDNEGMAVMNRARKAASEEV